MKKFLVSIIAISVVTSAMAASTLASGGENKSATSSATYRAGSLRVNKGVTETATASSSAAKKTEIGRLGSVKTISMKTSGSNTSGTGSSNNNNSGSSNNSNTGALTSQIQEQLRNIDTRLTATYDTAYAAASEVLAAKEAIRQMQNNLTTIEANIAGLQTSNESDISDLEQSISNLQSELTRLDNSLTDKVSSSTVSGLSSRILELENRTGAFANAGYLTSDDLSELRSNINDALGAIRTLQQEKIGADAIANFATEEYVNTKTNDMATHSWTNYKFDDRIGNIGDSNVKNYVDSSSAAVEESARRLVSDAKTDAITAAKEYTNEKVANLAVQQDVASAIADMATQTFVDNRIGFDAGRPVTVKQYVDNATNDMATHNWVNLKIGQIGEGVDVKGYVDGRFDDAADPTNPNGWGHHISELEVGQAELEATVADLDARTNPDTPGTPAYILGHEFADAMAELGQLDREVSDIDVTLNGGNGSQGLADRVSTIENNQENFATVELLNTTKNNLKTYITANMQKADANAAAIADIPNNYASKEQLQQAQDKMVEKQTFNNYMTAASNKFLPKAEFGTEFNNEVTSALTASGSNPLKDKFADVDTAVGLKANADDISASALKATVADILQDPAISSLVAVQVAPLLEYDNNTNHIGASTIAQNDAASMLK